MINEINCDYKIFVFSFLFFIISFGAIFTFLKLFGVNMNGLLKFEMMDSYFLKKYLYGGKGYQLPRWFILTAFISTFIIAAANGISKVIVVCGG